MTLLRDLKEAFSASPPDIAPPGGMTFEQRAMLIATLYDLKDRKDRSIYDWLQKLRLALG